MPSTQLDELWSLNLGLYPLEMDHPSIHPHRTLIAISLLHWILGRGHSFYPEMSPFVGTPSNNNTKQRNADADEWESNTNIKWLGKFSGTKTGDSGSVCLFLEVRTTLEVRWRKDAVIFGGAFSRDGVSRTGQTQMLTGPATRSNQRNLMTQNGTDCYLNILH